MRGEETWDAIMDYSAFCIDDFAKMRTMKRNEQQE